jgi:hypothetical protein
MAKGISNTNDIDDTIQLFPSDEADDVMRKFLPILDISSVF